MKEVAIIIPAYEPDERFINLLQEIKGLNPIIIVDDGSGEKYRTIFESTFSIIGDLQGKILTHSVNQGKGRALKTAFEYVLKNYSNVEAVVTVDCDGQHSAACIEKVIKQFYENSNCLILGVRQFNKQEIPWKSRFGNKITESIFKYIHGVHITDTQTGLRCIPRSFLKELIHTKGERFEFEMMMLVKAIGKYDIVEVTIDTIYDSKENHQTHFNPFYDSVKIYGILFSKFLKFLFSSVLSSILDLLAFYYFCLLLKPIYPILYIIFATIIARIISSVFNFSLNYKIVFKSKHKKSLTNYYALVFFQMIISSILVTAMNYYFFHNLEVLFKFIIDTSLFIMSYHVQQKFIFVRNNS